MVLTSLTVVRVELNVICEHTLETAQCQVSVRNGSHLMTPIPSLIGQIALAVLKSLTATFELPLY